MRQLFELIPSNKRKRVFWFLIISTLLIMFVMNLIGAPLLTEAAPSGIISYEFAGTISKTEEILASWDQNALLHAAFSLGLDYLFMVFYASAISFVCLWTSEVVLERKWPLAFLGIPLAWGLWLAALLDAIENLGLTLNLFGPVVSPWPEIARWCATFKFIFIFLGLVYSFYGLVVGLISKHSLQRM